MTDVRFDCCDRQFFDPKCCCQFVKNVGFGNPVLWGAGAMGLNKGSMSQRLFAQDGADYTHGFADRHIISNTRTWN